MQEATLNLAREEGHAQGAVSRATAGPFQCGHVSQRLQATFDLVASPTAAKPLYQHLGLEFLLGSSCRKVLLTWQAG